MAAARLAREAERDHEDDMTPVAANRGALAAAVDADRLWARHMAMARHGARADGGVDRQALSSEDAAARCELTAWGRAIGLEASTDAIGNLFLRLVGADPSLPPVMTGSHLDSQPTGGKFDGVYGVLAGLEALEAMVATGFRPRRSIDLVVWTNEEGSRFAPGMMGSEAFAGLRRLGEILAVTDAEGITVAAALESCLAASPAMPRRPLGGPVAAYLEAHIEQGPVLEAEGRIIGVVSGIQGKRTFRVQVQGEEAHAGTTPRRKRRDALVAAVAMIGALEQATADGEDVIKFTIGRLDVTPNAPSVVPSRVTFSIDLRHPDSATLQRLGDRIADICAAHAGPCTVAVRELTTAMSLEFPRPIRRMLSDISHGLGYEPLDLVSAAGHDSRQMHHICPSGMIFVPCRKGISHHIDEWAEAAHLAAGARVLVEALAWLSTADDTKPRRRGTRRER